MLGENLKKEHHRVKSQFLKVASSYKRGELLPNNDQGLGGSLPSLQMQPTLKQVTETIEEGDKAGSFMAS